MNGKQLVLLLCFCLATPSLWGQSMNIKSVQDIFRPNLLVRTHWLPAQVLAHDESVNFGIAGIRLETTIPLKGKVGIAFSMDKFRDWKKLKGLKKLTDLPLLLSGYQLFWTINAGTNSLLINAESPQQRTFNFSTGLLGIHSQKGYHLLFYSLNLNISESTNTLSQLSPHLNAFVGRANFKQLSFIYYYGLWMHYGDQQFLPIPFVGANILLSRSWDLQVVLPLQVKLTYSRSKQLRPSLAVGVDGFWTGFENTQSAWLPTSNNKRLHLSTNYLKVVASAAYRLGKRGQAQLSMGSNFRHQMVFRAAGEKLATFEPKAGFFITASYQTNLGSKSFLRGILERLELQ